MVSSIICNLDFSTTIGFCYRISHCIRDFTTRRIHNDISIDVSCSSSDNLKKRSFGSQESDFFSIEYPDKACFWKIEPFSEEIDPDNHINISKAIISEYFESLKSFNLTMEIANFETIFSKVCCEIFA